MGKLTVSEKNISFTIIHLAMKYLLDIPEERAIDAEKLFQSADFIEQFRVIASNEITNSTLLESIEA